MYAIWAYTSSEAEAREAEARLIQLVRPPWNGLGWGGSPYKDEIPPALLQRLGVAAYKARRASIKDDVAEPAPSIDDVLDRLRALKSLAHRRVQGVQNDGVAAPTQDQTPGSA
jgi:hypothetical protein